MDSEYEELPTTFNLIDKGIAFERVITLPRENILKLIQCGLCLEIAYKPLICTNCERLVCTSCLDHKVNTCNNETCPECGQLKLSSPPPRKYIEMLDELEFRCINERQCREILKYKDLERHKCKFDIFSCRGRKCEEVLPREEMEEHVNICPKLLIHCLYPNCSYVAERESIPEHMEGCEHLPVQCKGCQLGLTRKTVQDHQELCGEIWVHCINKDYGCSLQGKRIELREHEPNCESKPMICNNCEQKFSAKNFAAHMGNCPEGTLPCKECGFQLKRRELGDHSCAAFLGKMFRNQQMHFAKQLEIIRNEQTKLVKEFKTIKEQQKSIIQKQKTFKTEIDRISKTQGKIVENEKNFKLKEKQKGEENIRLCKKLSQLESQIQTAEQLKQEKLEKEVSLFNMQKRKKVGISGYVSASFDKSLIFMGLDLIPLSIYKSKEPLIKVIQLHNRSIATSKNSGEIEIINPQTMKQTGSLIGHTPKQWIWGMIQLSTGNLVSSSSDKTIRVWKVESGECVMVMEGHTSGVYSLYEHAKSGRLLSGGGDSTVRIWDLGTGEQVKVLDEYEGGIKQILQLPDDGNMISLCDSKGVSVKIWALETGETLRNLNTKTGFSSGCLSLDAKYMILGGYKTLALLDIGKMVFEKVYKVHNHWIKQVEMVGENQVITCSQEHEVKIVDIHLGTVISSIAQHTAGVYSVIPLYLED